ncbi:MAG: SDR family oxidoreductase [Pleurocapsa minor GSE-CHR-MK-17-07R]|jgi:gluconate 5-dehydrogenase|nr:SDR family oxidoreductase [Pleurocapsa minor GSE-CHR-MK 17-07R]
MITGNDIAQLFRLDGKVALVPGGYGGIGEAVCSGLAAAGASVIVAGHNAARCEALAETLRSEGAGAVAAPFDAHSVASIQPMVDQAAGHFGRLDILVNCVGLNREEKLLDITEENFDTVYSANLKSALFLSQAAARHMIPQGTGGKHVHLGSVRTLLGLRGRGYAAYCAAKGGLGTMAKQLAAELAPHNINVNVVAPTFVRTEQVAAMLADPVFYESLTARIPLGRVAEPEEVMHAILFFVSRASDFITGQVLYLDGGITATQ